jgi:hypothetical protein
MKRRSSPISVAPDRLLYSRTETRRLLGGISLFKVKELEQAGVLVAKRLDRLPNGKVFYTARNVHSVAGVDEGARDD